MTPARRPNDANRPDKRMKKLLTTKISPGASVRWLYVLRDTPSKMSVVARCVFIGS